MYLSNDHFWQGVPQFNSLVWGKPQTLDWEIWPKRTRNITLLCGAQHILNHLGMDHHCERQNYDSNGVHLMMCAKTITHNFSHVRYKSIIFVLTCACMPSLNFGQFVVSGQPCTKRSRCHLSFQLSMSEIPYMQGIQPVRGLGWKLKRILCTVVTDLD